MLHSKGIGSMSSGHGVQWSIPGNADLCIQGSTIVTMATCMKHRHCEGCTRCHPSHQTWKVMFCKIGSRLTFIMSRGSNGTILEQPLNAWDPKGRTLDKHNILGVYSQPAVCDNKRISTVDGKCGSIHQHGAISFLSSFLLFFGLIVVFSLKRFLQDHHQPRNNLLKARYIGFYHSVCW